MGKVTNSNPHGPLDLARLAAFEDQLGVSCTTGTIRLKPCTATAGMCYPPRYSLSPRAACKDVEARKTRMAAPGSFSRWFGNLQCPPFARGPSANPRKRMADYLRSPATP